MYANVRDKNPSGPSDSVVNPIRENLTKNPRDPLNCYKKVSDDPSSTSSEYVAEVKIPEQTDFQAGILKTYLSEWRAFTKDPIALQAVAGAKLPLKRTPLLKSPDQVLSILYIMECFKTYC